MIDQLAHFLTNTPLPGETAHIEMTPYRNHVARQLNHQKQPRKSAVAVLLFPSAQGHECILIQRPEYEGTHSAQVSFPGGKQEPDETLLQTALRETWEEIGIPSSHIEVMGTLTELYIPPSNFLVTPFVGVLSERPAYTTDPREVAEVFSFPVAELLQLPAIPTTKVALSNGLRLDTPYFPIYQKTVWGATAAILNELRHVLRSI